MKRLLLMRRNKPTTNKGATRGSWTSGLGDDQESGGGLWCESTTAVVSNCVVVGNSAGRQGGGVWAGTLNNCKLATNSSIYGGGTFESTLNHCTVIGNSAWEGGGAYESTLNNCISYFNTAPSGANYFQEQPNAKVSVNYSCITPIPPNGVGNISVPPLFVDYANGNLHLQTNSPCINAGSSSILSNRQYDWLLGNWFWVTNLFDLDGNPRIVSGTVDIGAYEYQGPGSQISYAWLQQFGLPADGSADATDPDGDGHTLWQEWRCGTCPTNALSVLRLLSASPAGTSVTVSWQSVAGVSYFLERSTNLAVSPCFTTVATNLVGQPGTASFVDTNAAGAGPRCYRVGVRN